MEGLRERINEIRDYYRLSNRGFAAALQTGVASTNNYLNGTKEPSMDFVNAILSKYVDISADWLLRGKGTMFYEDEKDSEEIRRELADAKVQMLIKQGVIDELTKIIRDRIGNKQELVSEKYREKLG